MSEQLWAPRRLTRKVGEGKLTIYPHNTHITTLCLHITLLSSVVSDRLRHCKELNPTDSRQVTTAVLRYDHAYDITAILDYSLFAPRRSQLRLSRYLNTDSSGKSSNGSRDIQILKVIEKESKDISFNFNEQPLGGVRLLRHSTRRK